MKRSPKSIKSRKELINLAIMEPDKAAEVLKIYAKRLSKAKKTTEIVNILAELLGVSEVTVFRDFSGL